MRPVGFIDDDPVKLGTVVHGVPVVGGTKDLAELCFRRGAKQALITIAAAPGQNIRRITKLCETARMPVKIIPGIYENRRRHGELVSHSRKWRSRTFSVASPVQLG